MVSRTAIGMMLGLIHPAGTLKPAGSPRTPRFSLDVEHSSRLQAVFGRSAVLATDSTRMSPLDRAGLLLDRCTCADVLC